MSLSPTRNGTAALVRGGPLDGLRFAAAFWMVLYHYAEQAPVSLFSLHPAFERGYLATNFFLMLSGYVLGRVYGERLQPGAAAALSFLKRRVARVYPAHLVMVGAFIALYLATASLGIEPQNPQWFDWSQLPAQILLVQSWGLPGLSGWNIVTWSLSALVVCYAAFPWLWKVLAGLRSPWSVLAYAVAALVLADLLSRTLLGYPVFQMPLRFGVVRALPLFFLGMALARISALVSLEARQARGFALAALGGFVALQLIGRFDYLSLAALAAVVLAAGAAGGRSSPLLASGAAMSFSLFLTNYFVGVAWFGVQRVLETRLGLGTSWLWFTWALAPLAAVAFAWVFQRLVDDPLQAWTKPLLSRDRRAAAAPVAQAAY